MPVSSSAGAQPARTPRERPLGAWVGRGRSGRSGTGGEKGRGSVRTGRGPTRAAEDVETAAGRGQSTRERDRLLHRETATAQSGLSRPGSRPVCCPSRSVGTFTEPRPVCSVRGARCLIQCASVHRSSVSWTDEHVAYRAACTRVFNACHARIDLCSLIREVTFIVNWWTSRQIERY